MAFWRVTLPNAAPHRFDQGRLGSRFGGAQAGFDFAPHLLNRIEVRRVGRQKADRRASRLDQTEGRRTLVRGEVVQDHDIARLQRRTQDLADIGSKHLRIGRALDGHAGSRAIQPQRADPGGGLPMALGTAGVNALTPRSATAQAGQVGLGPRLVEEDQFGGIEARLATPPRPARPRDIPAILLAGAERLFLYVSPSFAKA